ncbi:MAG: SecDF P1 head subdomain-containing protein [Planctomycetota bacterium]|jgi:SecD/SecF fusion protein
MIPDDSWGLKEVVADSDNNGRPAIRIIFDPAGAEQFNTLTKSNINRRLAILIDGKVITAPQIMMALSGQAMIAGGFTEEEADKMAAELKKGMPPVTLRPGGETESQN